MTASFAERERPSEDKKRRVRIEGCLSDVMLLCDMVFQGTVLGPSLWNAFFGDVAFHVPQGRQELNLFADDLSVMSSVA